MNAGRNSIARRWGSLPCAAGALLIAALGTAGCQANKQNADLLITESRQQEDRIYKLQDYIEQYQEMLAACQHENESLRAQLGNAAQPGHVAQPGRVTIPDKPIPRTRRETSPPPKMRDMLQIPGAPDVEIGEPFNPDQPGRSTPRFDKPAPPRELPIPGPTEGELPSPDSAVPRGEAATLAFNSLLTGGLDADNQPGDEGVMVVLEPRDEAGELIAPLGQLSLLVIDPATSQHVARWDFSADETAGAFRQTAMGRGLHFALPWPAAAPGARRLQVHARLVKSNGEKLLVDQQIKIEPPRAQAGNAAPAWSRSKRPIPKARPGSRTASTKRARSTNWNLHDMTAEAEEDEEASDNPTRKRARPVIHSEPAAEEVEEEESVTDQDESDRPFWSPFR